MRVTRLEIFGFKSFVDRFVLNFDKSILGIVGPNGCGKSNIVDALRWALGETHAKQLRGGVLEDLIFNGSQTRRPLGMAEVSITVRPDDGWAPATLARAKEIYQSVSQPGGAAEAVEEQPAALEEMPQAVETASTLLDIPGLFDAAEIQLTRRLYRSGESEYFINRIPCRLRDMVEFYHLIGLGSRGLSIVQQGQISDIILRKPLERRELLEEAAGIGGFRMRIEAAQRKLDRSKENLARLGDIMTEVEKQVRSLSRQAKRARERGALKEQLTKHELELFAARTILLADQKKQFELGTGSESGRLEILQRDLVIVRANEESARGEIETIDLQLSNARRKKEELMQTLAGQKSRENDFKLELARVEGKRKVARSAKERAGQRCGIIGQDIERRRMELVKHQEIEASCAEKRLAAEVRVKMLASDPERASGLRAEEQGALEQEVTDLKGRLELMPSLTAELESQLSRAKALQTSIQREKDLSHEKKVKAAAVESEVRSLKAQLSSLAEQVRRKAGSTTEEQGVEKVLLAVIKAPENLQKALAAVLGEKASYLISDDSEQLASHFLERKRGAKVTGQFGVISRTPREGREQGEIRTGRRLIDSLEIEEGYRQSVEALLGRVCLVSDLQDGFGTIAASPQSIAVTEDGEVIASWGWYATEGEGVGFAFTRLIEEREKDAEQLRSELEEIESHLQELQSEHAETQDRVREKSAERDQLHLAQKRLSIALQQLQEIERQRRKVMMEDERVAQEELRVITRDHASAERSVIFEENRIKELEQELEELGREEQRASQEENTLSNEEELLKMRLTELMQETSGCSHAQLEDSIRAIDQEIRGIETGRGKVKVRMGELLQDQEELRREIEKLQESLNQQKLSVERLSIEREMHLEEMRKRYGESISFPSDHEVSMVRERAANDLSPYSAKLEKDVHALYQRLEREGEVDPESIPQYEQEKKRLEEMKSQSADLELAASTLDRTIKHLQDISRERFLDTFRDVREKFGNLVPRLFGGGAGHLELVNPDDPLGSGVEISLRPPGKKIRSMELLSGGEKALAAAAMLVAMFLHRPSPICVLDEVDAPLDDANIDRFLALIREISTTTQFLVITHNKQTMASADRLVGITMQESGVSKALSVSLDEAANELERRAVNQ